MRKVEFIEECGRMHDLFSLFRYCFSREFLRTAHADEKGLESMFDGYDELLARIPAIPEELRIFFTQTSNSKSLALCHFDPQQKKNYIFKKYTLETVKKIPEDCDRIKKWVIRHYFPELDDAEREECEASVAAISRRIRQSDYDDSIKSGLYAFFIEPEAILRKLAEELLAKDAFLREEYARAAEKLAELRAEFDFEWVIRSLLTPERAETVLCAEREAIVSFMLFEKREFVCRNMPEGLVLLLGCEYRRLLEEMRGKTTAPKLEDFGQAMSDPNRVAILKMVRERGQVTVREIEQEIGLSGTNVYYHLTMLQKVGMLQRGSCGKTAYFSLQTSYFRGLCQMLEGFTKLPEPKKE